MMELSIVIPVYKEEASIEPFLKTVQPILDKLTREYEIIFALDPSPDRTADIIQTAHDRDPRIKLLLFSRRFGQPMATLGGLQHASGKAVIVMDVDLQDPPEVIPQMVQKWKEGFDVVYGSRRSRTGEPMIYRTLTWIGYRAIHWLAEDINIPRNTGDFRLMSRRALDELLRLKESHGFLRGMVALVGFRQTAVLFDRPGRQTGKSHYNAYVGSLKIAINGFVCFSNRLLRVTTYFGFFTAGMAFLTAIVYTAMKLNGFDFPLGNPTIVILVLFLGGVQLVSVGILGEYIGRIYDEVKERPRVIIDRTVGLDTPHTSFERG